MLGKIKELMEAQKRLQDMKRDLESLVVEHSTASGKISVTMNGTQRILDISVSKELLSPEKQDAVQKGLVECINGAADKVQREAALKLKASMGDIKIPGL